MTKIINNFKNYKILYLAIGFTLIFFSYLTLALVPLSSCFRLDTGPNSLGLSFSYTKEMVNNFFESRNQDQLICYSQFLQIWDPIFAIISSMMFGSWILCLFKNKRLFLIIPNIMNMIADWLENYTELLMIETYLTSGMISKTLVSLGSGINSFKFLMIGLSYLIILTGIIMALKFFLINIIRVKR